MVIDSHRNGVVEGEGKNEEDGVARSKLYVSKRRKMLAGL